MDGEMEMEMDIDFDLDLDGLAKKYFHISREEIQGIKRECDTASMFLILIENIQDIRENEKILGSQAIETGCLANILSITVQPSPLDKQVELYGRISAEFFNAHQRRVVHKIYTRRSDVPEILGTEGTLTLNGPRYMCWPTYAGFHAGFPLCGSRVKVKLFDQTNKIFARTSFCLDDIGDDDYEQVKSLVVPCQQCSLTFKYIAIPFGVFCRLKVVMSSLKDVDINVNGKIVARYDHTYGKYSSEECVLFKKQDTEFGRVEVGQRNSFPLSRCWVSVPAYSSLIIEVDLSEFGSGQKIGNGIIKLLPRKDWSGFLVLDDMLITAEAAFFSPHPLGRKDYQSSSSLTQKIPTSMIEEMETKQGSPTKESEVMNIEGENLGQEIEELDIDGEDESSSADDDYDEDDGSSIDESSSFGWWKSLDPHKDKLWLTPAVEIFSVLIGQEKSKAVQIYGSIEVLCGYKDICCIFERDEKYAFGLSENLKSIPIPDGSQLFDEDLSLKIKCDIKDVDGCLAIKGYADWATPPSESSLWYEKQVCSLIQGQHGGFAAIHYSLFEKAVGVNIKVSLNVKTGGVDVNPKVWGSLVTQYSHYDYSSRYSKDYYRSVLFKRTRDDLIQISNDSTIPLSRSTIVVPSYSALVVNVDLSFGVAEQKLSCVKTIEIGEDLKTEEIGYYVLSIVFDWCEIK